jgi:hypothetical protein
LPEAFVDGGKRLGEKQEQSKNKNGLADIFNEARRRQAETGRR